MKKNIFINYRREDSNWISLAIYNKLLDSYDSNSVFKDFNTIEPGNDFVVAIETALNNCSVLLIIIAKDWLKITNDTGQLKMHSPNDFVRIEIEKAREKQKIIIPVLVDNISMPNPNELPDSIQFVTRLQAFELSTKRFDNDIERLVNVIDKLTNFSIKKRLVSDPGKHSNLSSQELDITSNKSIIKLFEKEPDNIPLSKREMCFASGNIGSTYGIFSEDIKHVSEELKLNLIRTGGSQESIELLLDDKSSFEFAITQIDILEKYKEQKDKLAIVLPLYEEEFHFVVRKNDDIHNLMDLNAKRIGLALKGGAFYTAKRIRDILSLQFEIVGRNSKEAFNDLNSRKIDAIYRNDGVPAENFGKLPKAAERFYRLLNLDQPELDKLYKKAKIPKDSYFWCKDEINTYSVLSVLVCRNHSKDSTGYEAIKVLCQSIINNIEQLRMFGHIKWNNVKFNACLNCPIELHPASKTVFESNKII